MIPTVPLRVLLGPQRPTSNLRDAGRSAGLPEGPLAVVSAGWQEAEGDIDDVRALVERDLVDLRLYARTETLFAADDALRAAYRQRQEKLIELQRLYRLRLRNLMIATRRILGAEGDADMLAPEQRHAIAQLRALDRHHCNRVQAIHRAFTAEYHPSNYAPLRQHAEEISAVVAASSGILITGGNVVVLLNRLRLFDMAPVLRRSHVIAWSAGAMVLADNIVLFHDRTPQGRRDAEQLGAGLGVLPGLVILPDANHRLRAGDRLRTSLFSRRFSPDTCVTLDCGSELRFEDERLVAAEASRRLTLQGRLTRVKPQ
ncbi:MAG: Type 1 glutamine amidotransferase-like domain-containing protein [Woeseiaceae bacterium]|nr:Type 1 glutamine amidotransferase-like domain-containing protein [Woeseiaceae bacterium]